MDATNYSGHSFRIGAATTAARAGFTDSFIQTLERWKSQAFTTYLRTPVEDLVAASARLAAVKMLIQGLPCYSTDISVYPLILVISLYHVFYF